MGRNKQNISGYVELINGRKLQYTSARYINTNGYKFWEIMTPQGNIIKLEEYEISGWY